MTLTPKYVQLLSGKEPPEGAKGNRNGNNVQVERKLLEQMGKSYESRIELCSTVQMQQQGRVGLLKRFRADIVPGEAADLLSQVSERGEVQKTEA